MAFSQWKSAGGGGNKYECDERKYKTMNGRSGVQILYIPLSGIIMNCILCLQQFVTRPK